MFNIIIDHIKVCFLSFAFIFILNAAYAQSPTMLSKSKSEEKILDNINSESWILPQYFNKEKKEEIIKYVLPENDMFGNIIENPDAPPLIEIVKDKKLIGYAFETYDWVQGLGYSRKPYHIIAGINLEGIVTGVRLMWHTEPIAILGRTDEDLHDFLLQLQGININKGISIVLGLSDSVLEGETVAMRGTAGDTSQLQPVDGISRTTTTSLLLNDAVMRAARKVARYKNIILDDRDLGTILNLEIFNKQEWSQLLENGSISNLKVTNGDIVKQFETIENFNAPRSARLSK